MQAKNIALFLVVYSLSISYFILKTYGDPFLFGATIAYLSLATTSFIAALYTRAEESYYEDLTLYGLLKVLAALAGMVAVSSFFVGVIGRSVLYFPTVFATLATVGGATSIFTSFLGEMVYQFTSVAVGEEALKFSAYTVLKERYGKYLAVGLAVGFWAGFHALQAYPNVLYVIPAFICGIILIWLLESCKSVIAPILAHGFYNTISLYFTYVNMSPEIPWFPTQLTNEDVLLVGLAAMWIAFTVLPIFLRKR